MKRASSSGGTLKREERTGSKPRYAVVHGTSEFTIFNQGN